LTIFGQTPTGKVSDAQLTAGLAFTRTLGAVARDTSAFFAAQNSSGTSDRNAAVAAFPARHLSPTWPTTT